MTMRRRRVRGDASVVARRAIERKWATKVDRGIDRVDARGRRLSTRRRRRRPVGARRSARRRIRNEFQYNEEEVASRDGRRKSTRARREEGIGVIETPRRALKRDRTARGEEGNGRAEAQLGNDAENVSFMYDEKVTCVTSPLELLSARTIDIRNATASAATTRRASSASPRPFAATAPRTRSRTFTSRARIMFTAARASATMLRRLRRAPRPTPRAAAASAPLGRVAATPLRAVVARARATHRASTRRMDERVRGRVRGHRRGRWVLRASLCAAPRWAFRRRTRRVRRPPPRRRRFPRRTRPPTRRATPRRRRRRRRLDRGASLNIPLLFHPRLEPPDPLASPRPRTETPARRERRELGVFRREDASRLIFILIRRVPPLSDPESLPCAGKEPGRVIGKGGATINRIQDETGARIDVLRDGVAWSSR